MGSQKAHQAYPPLHVRSAATGRWRTLKKDRSHNSLLSLSGILCKDKS